MLTWKIKGDAYTHAIVDPKGNVVARIDVSELSRQGIDSRPIARKISLAPDMFEAILSLARARHESTEAMRRASYDPKITRLFELVEELAEE